MQNISSKPVHQKLLMKPGKKVLFINEPAGYDKILGGLPPDLKIAKSPNEGADIIQLFVKDRKELEQHLAKIKNVIKPETILWITYYKGTSKTKTDINRDSIFTIAKEYGLQGVAMVSIDKDWSAFRLKTT